jgi:hypothetical protein
MDRDAATAGARATNRCPRAGAAAAASHSAVNGGSKRSDDASISETAGWENPNPDKGKEDIDQRRVKAARHPLRVQILNILTDDGPHSPKMMSAKLDQPLNSVSYHMSTVLFKECDLIEPHKEIPRRGAVEHVYRIKAEASVAHPDWQKMLPDFMAADVKATALKSLIERIINAAAASDPEAVDPDDAIGWVPVRVDRRGRKQVAKILTKALADVAAVEADCGEQCDRDPSKAVTLTVGVATLAAADHGAGVDDE